MYHPSQKFRLELAIDNLKEYVGDEYDGEDAVDGPTAVVGNSKWWLRAEASTSVNMAD